MSAAEPQMNEEWPYESSYSMQDLFSIYSSMAENHRFATPTSSAPFLTQHASVPLHVQVLVDQQRQRIKQQQNADALASKLAGLAVNDSADARGSAGAIGAGGISAGGVGALVSPPPHLAQPQLLNPAQIQWYYLDPQGVQQGPFDGNVMQQWYQQKYLTGELKIRRAGHTGFKPLAEFLSIIGEYRFPFAVPLPSVTAAPSAQSSGPATPLARGAGLAQAVPLGSTGSLGAYGNSTSWGVGSGILGRSLSNLGNLSHLSGNLSGNLTGSSLAGSLGDNLDSSLGGNLTGGSMGNLPGSANLPGNLPGNGNLQGNLTGNLPGNLPGNLQGNLQGLSGISTGLYHQSPFLQSASLSGGLFGSEKRQPSEPVTANPAAASEGGSGKSADSGMVSANDGSAGIATPAPVAPVSREAAQASAPSPVTAPLPPVKPIPRAATPEPKPVKLQQAEPEKSIKPAPIPASVWNVPEAKQPAKAASPSRRAKSAKLAGHAKAMPVKASQAKTLPVKAKSSAVVHPHVKLDNPTERDSKTVIAPWAGVAQRKQPVVSLVDIAREEQAKAAREERAARAKRAAEISKRPAAPHPATQASGVGMSLPTTSTWGNSRQANQQQPQSLEEIQREELAKEASAARAAPRRARPHKSMAESLDASWTVVSSRRVKPVVKPTAKSPAGLSPAALRSVSARKPAKQLSQASVWKTVGGAAGVGGAQPKKAPAASSRTAHPARAATTAHGSGDLQDARGFLAWCNQQLGALNGKVNKQEVLSVLLQLPLGPESTEIVADTIYSNSATMDGRRFAGEFSRRRTEVEQYATRQGYDFDWQQLLTGKSEGWDSAFTKVRRRRH